MTYGSSSRFYFATFEINLLLKGAMPSSIINFSDPQPIICRVYHNEQQYKEVKTLSYVFTKPTVNLIVPESVSLSYSPPHKFCHVKTHPDGS